MTESTSLPCANTGSDTARKSALRWTAVLLTALLAVPVLAAPVKKFKWLTPAGETIFRPTPPDDPNQPYCHRLDDGPWTCVGGADQLEPPPPDPDIMTAEEKQRQEDLLLRTRYRSLDDIERQLQEELDQVEFQRNVALSNQRLQQAQLFTSIRVAADRQRAGMTVKDEQLAQVHLARENLRMTEDTLNLIAAEETRLRERHELRRTRFLQLMEQYASP
jgi:hypothetical protein